MKVKIAARVARPILCDVKLRLVGALLGAVPTIGVTKVKT
jgi:hypothetical protein